MKRFVKQSFAIIISKRKSLANSSFDNVLLFIIVKSIVTSTSWKFFTNTFSFVNFISIFVSRKFFVDNFLMFAKSSYVSIIVVVFDISSSLFSFVKNFFANFATKFIVVIKLRRSTRFLFSFWWYIFIDINIKTTKTSLIYLIESKLLNTNRRFFIESKKDVCFSR